MIQDPPSVGDVVDGYIYLGGDPASESSWREAPRGGTFANGRPRGLTASEDRELAVAREAARDALAVMPDLERFSRLNEREMSGGVMAIPFADRLAGAFDGGISQMNEITARLAPAQREPGSGTTSDRDLALFLQAVPSVQRPRAANDALIERGRNEGRRRAAYADFLDRYAAQHGSLKGADEVFRAMVANGQIDLATYGGGDTIAPDSDGNGIPQYPSIEALTANVIDSAGPPPTGPGGGPSGPGSSSETAINYADPSIPPQQLVEMLAKGGWLRNGEGEPYYVEPKAVRRAAPGEGAEEVRPGVFQRPSRDGVSERREDMGLGRRLDALVRGAADTITFGTADEISAGLNTVLPLERGSVGGWSEGFGDAYRQNLRLARGLDQADAEQMPLTRGTGQIAGAFIGGAGAARVAPSALRYAPRVAGASRGANAARIAANTGRAGLGGASMGGVYGFGSAEGTVQERLPSAGRGVVIGGATGFAAPVVANVAGRVTSPVMNALADGARFTARPLVNALGDAAPGFIRRAVAANPLARGAERFAGTNRPNIEAIRAERARLEEAVGRPVAAASAINTGGRALLRGIATTSDDARAIAENFGQGTVEALPARIGQQARRILSQDTRSPDEIRAALQAERSALAREKYAEPYASRVVIDDETATALSGAPGRAAIQRARSAAEAFNDMDAMQELDALATGQTREVSAATLDRIRQAMSGRAERLAQNPATRAIGAGVQQRAGAVDTALDNVDGLAPARAAYRDMSRQIEAVDAGERFAGNTPDVVASAMRGAPESAQAPFRAAAARSIERAAGTTGAAPGVANRLAIPGTPQRQMMDETLGPDAERLANAMRAERDIYRGARQVDPGEGSQTVNNALKVGEAAGMVGDVVTGRPLSAIQRFIGHMDQRGFNDEQAEAVLRAMTDPARTDEVIDLLAQRMTRRDARNLVRALRYQITTSLPSGQQR